MKLLISILLLISCVTNAQNFYNGVPTVLPTIAHPTNVSAAPFITNQTRSDTMVVTGSSLGSSYFGQITGMDSLHPFVVYYNNTNGAGIGIENCHYFKCIGIGTATLNGGGTNGYVKGLVDYVQVSGFLNLDGLNGSWWIKLESPQSCDYSPNQLLYLNGLANNPVITNRMLHIWFTKNKIGNSDGSHSCGGEGVYAISTGAYGRDPVPCLANVIYKPLWGGYFHIDSNQIYNCGRSAIQLSGCDLGYNTINGNLIRHAGRELNSTQGAAIRTGYGTNNTTEIAYNDIKYTYLYNLDIETGANVHNNIMDSAGWYDATHKNPQQIPSVICYASLPLSILKLQYNTAGVNSAQPSTNYAIYGGANYATSGNIVCGNNGNVQVLSLPFNYTTTCNGQDTTCITRDTSYYVDADTTFHFDSTFRDSIGKVTKITYIDTVVHKSGKYTVRLHFNKPVDSTFRVLVRAAYDSMGICSLCKLIDTTYQQCIFPKIGYGAAILDGYNGLVTTAQKLHYAKATLGVKYLRENYMLGNTWQNQQYLDSGIYPMLTYNVYQFNAVTPQPFYTTISQVSDSLNVKFKISKPYAAAFINEPPDASWDTTNNAAQLYVIGLNAFIPVCHANGVIAVGGGSTTTLCYRLANYYQTRGLTDSLTWLETVTGIGSGQFFNSANGIYWNNFYSVMLNAERNSAEDYTQLHYYAPPRMNPTDSTTDNGLLTVLINFLLTQTGKPIITFETGIGNYSQTLFNDMFTEWAKNVPVFLLYFFGAGANSVPNETYFLNFKTNNP